MYKHNLLILFLMLLLLAGCMPQTNTIQQSTPIETRDLSAEAPIMEIQSTAVPDEENKPEKESTSILETGDQEQARSQTAEAASEEKSSDQAAREEVEPVDDESTAVQPTQGAIAIDDPEQTPSKKPDPSMRVLTEKARADLAQVLDLEPGEIRLMEARVTEGPDAGLGCPQPDMVYADVTTPGYWILLQANNQLYSYHTDNEDQIVLCMYPGRESGEPGSEMPFIPVDPGGIQDGIPWVPVK
jgi:hypothetical protein